jgi:hypothetical protein
MKIRRCVLLLLLWMCWGIVLPVMGHTADTDRQVLNALLTELEQKIGKADERMVAHPKFLDELRALVKQYRAKLRVVFFSDDFSDGDYRYNPAWVVDSGSFQVNASHRLSSEVIQERPAAPQASREKSSPFSGIVRDILSSPKEESKKEAPPSVVRESRIHTLAQVGPAFEVDLTLVSKSSSGSMEIVLMGGNPPIPQYRMVYHPAPSAERPIEIIRERDGRSYQIESANQYPSLDDGLPHRIQWSRDSQDRLRVAVDGKEVLSTYEGFYRNPFTGLALVNKGGTYEWGPILVLQAQEAKAQ